jgi:hypothetical protein
MGGRGIAHWEDGKIVINDLGSKAAKTVQRFLRKETPRNKLAEGVENANRVLFGAVKAVKKR